MCHPTLASQHVSSHISISECVIPHYHLSMCHPTSASQHVSSHIGEQTKECFNVLSESVSSSSSTLKGFLIERNSASRLTASLNIAPLIAKQDRPHTIADDLIKTAIMEACKLANIFYSRIGSLKNSFIQQYHFISHR